MSNRDKWLDTLDPVIRTFFQSFIGIFVALTVTGRVAEVPGLDALRTAALAAAWSAFVACISLIQNALENLRVIPSAGRDIPPVGPAGDA